VVNVVRTKKCQQSVKLAYAHPFEHINMLLNGWIGLAGECGGTYTFYTGFSRCVRDQSRVNTVSGNDSEDLWNSHNRKLTAVWHPTKVNANVKRTVSV
jgi:hypothetical protein